MDANSVTPPPSSLVPHPSSLPDSSVSWRPRVSIVLVTQNHVDYTRQCLAAIAANTPGGLYELIIVDNGSVDGTAGLLRMLEGDVQAVLHDANLGFAVACNAGAALAQGDYLVFLHNDTIPQPDWLDSLVALADREPSAGVVGAKLVGPDGLLQSAGRIVWSDGSMCDYGTGGHPADPRYCHVREVDSLSSAALLVRRELWERLGGFDSTFSPAHYDDADLCFQARGLGHTVLYQPASEVVHYGGITLTDALGDAAGRAKETGRLRFIDRWSAELAGRLASPEGDVPKQAALTGRDKNLLVVDPFLPMYDRSAGSRRLWELLRIMRGAGHHITFIARNGLGAERYVGELQQLGVEVYPTDPTKMAEMGVSCPGIPRVPLDQLCRDLRYDVVWLSFWEVGAQYMDELRRLAPSATFVADSVDVHFVREERRARLEGTAEARQRAREVRERELAVYAAADRIVTVTEEDRQALLPLLPDKEIVVVPNVHPTDGVSAGFDEREGLLFVANFNHPPNLDGIEWFCRDVLPRIRREAPEIVLHIVGNSADAACKHLIGPGVTVTGFVDDLAPFLQGARLSVAPLRYGGGLKGKVGEALAAGLPVVTTPAGAEGFDTGASSGIIVARDTRAFTDAVIDAHRDRDRWNTLAAHARATVEHLTPERVAPAALATFANAGRPARHRRPLISIVMLTMNELPYTRLAIESLIRHTDHPYELIVIDNGSTDGTPDYLRSIPGLHLIANPRNRGFAPACNQGLAVARGDYALLLNNDVVLTEGWLDRLVAHAERDPRIGLAGPITNCIVGPQQVAAEYGADLDAMHGFARRWHAKHRGEGEEVRRVIGFAMLIRRAVLDAIGGLDERYGNGSFEDDDYCIRARGAGFKIWMAADTFIHHFGSQTYKGNRMDLAALMHRNWQQFAQKWELPPGRDLSAGYAPEGPWALAQNVTRFHVPLQADDTTGTSYTRGRTLAQAHG